MNEKPEVRVRPNEYQPSKAEVEEAVVLDGTPEDLRAAVMKPVHVIEDPNA